MKITLHNSASPYGITTIESYVNGCSRRAILDAENRDPDGPVGNMPLAPLAGVLFHALCEHYYTTGKHAPLDEIEWEGGDVMAPNWAAAEEKAVSAFLAYRLSHEPDEWGKIVGVETALSTDDASVVGCAPFTGRVDLIVDVTRASDGKLKKSRGIDISPGRYIVDHKLVSSIRPITLERYRWSPQPIAYMALVEHTLGKPVKGAIVNLVQASRNVEVHTVVIRPSTNNTARLRQITQAPAMSNWPTMVDRPNISRCWDYESPCSHWVSARCTGA